jgi:hypothetical protein
MSEKQAKRKRKSTASGRKRGRRSVQQVGMASPLPEPVDVSPEPSRENSSSPIDVLRKISDVFDSRNLTSQNQNQQSADGGKISLDGESITPEKQTQLNAVPDVIGDEAKPDASASAEAMDSGAAAMVSVLDGLVFSEQDVADTLTELFSWLADKFGSDHWLLSERQQRMLGGPTAQVVNASWVKLREKLPDILARWCESTPGATAFLMAFGIVVVPKAMKQMKLSRERKATIDVKREEKKPEPAQPSRPVQTGIPQASGIIGG